MKIEFYLQRASKAFKEIANLPVYMSTLEYMDPLRLMTSSEKVACDVLFRVADAIIEKYSLRLPTHWQTLKRSMLDLGADPIAIKCTKKILRVEIAERCVSELVLMWRKVVRNLGGELDTEIAFSEQQWEEWSTETSTSLDRSRHLHMFKEFLPVIQETTLIGKSIPIDVYTAHAILSQTPFVPELANAVFYFTQTDPFVKVVSIVCEKLKASISSNGVFCHSITEWIHVICTYFSRLMVIDDNLFGPIKK